MPYNYLLHHSESVDPELIEAIIHKIMSATGFSSFTMTWKTHESSLRQWPR